MVTSKLFFGSASLVALAFVAGLAGCAADTSPADDEAVVEESSDELTAADKALIGSYSDDSGAFKGLVLTSKKVGQRNEFFADVDTGIRCITAPCPSSERLEGTFTAGTKTITLYSTTAVHAKHLLGKYDYRVQGDKLTLSRKGFEQSLAKSGSYCSTSSDCYEQNIIHPMCMGGFTCTPQNTCSYKCGVWPPPPPVATVCLSSNSCAAGEHCSTEDGVCNPHGMLAVCAGTCVAGGSK